MWYTERVSLHDDTDATDRQHLSKSVKVTSASIDSEPSEIDRLYTVVYGQTAYNAALKGQNSALRNTLEVFRA